MKRVFLSAFILFLGFMAIDVLIVHIHYTSAKEMHVNDPNFTIQEAIVASNNGDTIIVGIGTYYENIDFLNKNISVRSTNPYDPDIVASTIIDGGGEGSVITFDPNVNNNPELSGFTIQNGMINLFGAGINCINSSPNIHHCIIRNNKHVDDFIGYGGAGISCTENSSPNIHDCSIINNNADYGSGAGIYCSDSSPRIVYCTIRNNSTLYGQGGGICCLNNSQVNMEECNIIENQGRKYGGGIMCDGSSSLTIDNCLISNNRVLFETNESKGGGIYCRASSLTIVNCTLSNNIANEFGGGIFYDGSLCTAINCILWNNQPEEIYAIDNDTLTVSYSCIQGGYAGTGNIDANPAFVNPDPNNADYHLSPNSPCIDSCNPNITDPCGEKDFDLDHRGRPQDGDNDGSCIFDMGAYEFCPDPDGDGLCGTNDPCPNDPNNNEANNDGDNFMVCEGDCDDSDPNVYPDAPELCDSKDNDCDTQTDEDFNIGVSCDGIGACGTGIIECADLNTTRCSTDPGGSQDQSTSEICDGLDNDCDAQTDEGFNIGIPCDGIGACGTGVIECADLNTTRCSTDPGGSQDQSTAEICDGLDNNCDAQTDEGFNIGDSCTVGTGVCTATGVLVCTQDGTGSECDAVPGVPGVEQCDGLDNDCDGTTDEDFIDTDNDNIADCIDECPNDPNNICMDCTIHIEPDTIKIISFVHKLDDNAAINVFGNEVRENYKYPKLFKIGTYNPELGNYIEYGVNLIVEPGKGYWCYSKKGLDIVFNDVMPVNPDDNEVKLLFDSNTNDGWNMIACPYNTHYLWDDVQVWGCDPNGLTGKTIYELVMENDCSCIDRLLLWKWQWETATYVYYNPNPDPNSVCGNEPDKYERDPDPNMRPNVGYWINVKKENVYLRFPPLNIPKAKYSNDCIPISDITSQSLSTSRTPVTNAAGDSPPEPLGGRPNKGSFSETGSGGCFINIIFFGLPKYTH